MNPHSLNTDRKDLVYLKERVHSIDENFLGARKGLLSMATTLRTPPPSLIFYLSHIESIGIMFTSIDTNPAPREKDSDVPIRTKRKKTVGAVHDRWI